jgi:protein-S-isoprenylcysteine O-methyltransferase Ste14
MTYTLFYLTIWLAGVVYWIVTAAGNKRTAYRPASPMRIPFFLGVIGLIWLFHAFPGTFGQRMVPFSATCEWTGIMVCALGVALAIWARRTLGRNWSGTPTTKEGHELIEVGPYRLVRHPIYTGIIVALLGDLIGSGKVKELIVLIYASVAIWLKLRVEESLMKSQFPQAYPEYMKRTKALFPFIL